MKSNHDGNKGRVEAGAGRIALPRRGFMKGLGAASLGLAAGSVLGAGPAGAASGNPVVEFASESCGEAGPRLLVGYASTCGTTGDVAVAIGKALCAAGARVDVRLLAEAGDPSGYDGFVLGSPIHGGQWMGDALKFLARNRALLADKKTALFITCMALSENTPANRKLAESYLKAGRRMAPRVEPVAQGSFAGAVVFERMPKKYVAMMRQIHPGDADARDWDAIGQWAAGLVPLLVTG